MSTATAQPPMRPGNMQRRLPRFLVAVPVDISVLRSGVPDSIPGRTVDVCETGLAAVIAGELRAGDLVGLELRLPTVGARLQAKAVVRHHERLRCGLEFLNLSLEQRSMIRYWTERSPQLPASSPQIPETGEVKALPETTRNVSRRRVGWRKALKLALGVVVVVGAVGGWQWYRTWNELESHLREKPVASAATATQVPADVMEQRVIHKVEPMYPSNAREANVQGVVLLDTVIARDGTVIKVQPVSGPEALTSAAVEAVRWWRFEPYQVNGEPTDVETTLAVEFRM